MFSPCAYPLMQMTYFFSLPGEVCGGLRSRCEYGHRARYHERQEYPISTVLSANHRFDHHRDNRDRGRRLELSIENVPGIIYVYVVQGYFSYSPPLISIAVFRTYRVFCIKQMAVVALVYFCG